MGKVSASSILREPLKMLLSMQDGRIRTKTTVQIARSRECRTPNASRTSITADENEGMGRGGRGEKGSASYRGGWGRRRRAGRMRSTSGGRGGTSAESNLITLACSLKVGEFCC